MKNAMDLVTAAKTRVTELPVSEAEAAIRGADVLLDVREESEFANGHLQGALHASRGMLEFKLSSTPALASRDLKVGPHCKTSGRAALTAVAMQDMGYLHIQSIAGGFDGWVAAGKPVVKPELPSFG
jgi:rhodanese-related sulfurtransferase